jgi:hypothetical protein
MKCPHCNRGDLTNPYHVYQYDYYLYTCSICGRGWHQDKKGNWHSHFATDIETYSPDGKKMLYNLTQDGLIQDCKNAGEKNKCLQKE